MRVTLVLALVTATATASGRAQQPTFSTKVEAVRVDVLVTERGHPVRDVRTDEFEVFDNGVRQQVDLATFEDVPLNVVLVLDTSDSVAGERLDHLRAAGRSVLDGLRHGDRAALMTFSEMVVLNNGLTGEIELVRGALARVTARGGTAVIDGSYAGLMLGESDVGRSLLILFSDGLDTSSWLSADAVLETAKRCDVVVYSVSTGKTTKHAFLAELSALTGGTLIEIESTRNLDAVFLRILDEFRQRYLLSYTPRGVSKEGWHRLDVRVKRRNTTVNARPGYLGGSPAPRETR